MNHDDGGEHATYGQYAGGTGVDATSIDTDAMDLLTYPGWGEMDSVSYTHLTLPTIYSV